MEAKLAFCRDTCIPMLCRGTVYSCQVTDQTRDTLTAWVKTVYKICIYIYNLFFYSAIKNETVTCRKMGATGDHSVK